ncbi:small kinetochore-associated protein [Salarias fasciatus]|uniref:Cingulin-like protein 1 n=1 Tax=Salarias fasciatus TaxID=181472 RepID=A0A672IXA2_SALFA|nr:cingulin-like protein 1 [Salarias fasciatus]XP_029966535.1 cingulin-like protein 1 [Salarias fasciatus]
MTSKIPKGLHLPPETKRIDHKVESKAPAAPAAVHKSDGILKHTKENVPRKNVASKVYKGVSTRYGQQAELKEQNQHLTAANEELQGNLSEMQHRVEELERQFSELEKENVDIKKNLKDCHVLLVAAQIDPVSGETVGETQRQAEDRQEAMSVSKDLLNELKAFGEVASQQRAQLEEIQTTMADLMKARGHMMQERENFSQQAAEITEALKEAEALLM